MSSELEMRRLAQRAISSCRSGRWEQGLPILARLVDSDRTGEHLPGRVYTYYGYGIAHFQGKHREGLHFCEQGTRLEFYHADNFYNLARIYLLTQNRRDAYRAIQRGLHTDPEHTSLAKLHQEIGVRRQPVIRGLARSNPVNRLLGRLRHQLTRSVLPPRQSVVG